MKQSYLESLISFVAKIKQACSHQLIKKINDNTLTSVSELNGLETEKKSFLKINRIDTPVGINFANISAGIYSVLNRSAQPKISYITELLSVQ